MDDHMRDIRLMRSRLAQAGLLSAQDDTDLKETCKDLVLKRRRTRENVAYARLVIEIQLLPPGLRFTRPGTISFATRLMSTMLDLPFRSKARHLTMWLDRIGLGPAGGSVDSSDAAAAALEGFETQVLAGGGLLTEEQLRYFVRRWLRTALLLVFFSWGDAEFRLSALSWADEHWEPSARLGCSLTAARFFEALGAPSVEGAITALRMAVFVKKASAFSPVARSLFEGIKQKTLLGSPAALDAFEVVRAARGARDAAGSAAASTGAANRPPPPTAANSPPSGGSQQLTSPTPILEALPGGLAFAGDVSSEAAAFEGFFQAFALEIEEAAPGPEKPVPDAGVDFLIALTTELAHWKSDELSRVFAYFIAAWSDRSLSRPQQRFLRVIYDHLWVQRMADIAKPLNVTAGERTALLRAVTLPTRVPLLEPMQMGPQPPFVLRPDLEPRQLDIASVVARSAAN